MKILKTEQEFQDFISSDNKVMIDFFAEWCGPCKAMLPLLETADAKIEGEKIAKVNIDENRDLANKFSIRSIPTVMIFQNGIMVDKKIGMIKNVDEIIQLLN